jgi:hypothetical protein
MHETSDARVDFKRRRAPLLMIAGQTTTSFLRRSFGRTTSATPREVAIRHGLQGVPGPGALHHRSARVEVAD